MKDNKTKKGQQSGQRIFPRPHIPTTAESLRTLLENVLFEETELGLRAKLSKSEASLFAASNLTVGQLGDANLPAGYDRNAKLLAWWDALEGGFVFIPKGSKPLPLYSKLQRLPVIGPRAPRSSNAPMSPSPNRTPPERSSRALGFGRYSECGHCGAPLRDRVSQDLGFGPECRQHYSVKELRRRSTHRQATRTREWVEDVTMDELMVDGKDRRL